MTPVEELRRTGEGMRTVAAAGDDATIQEPLARLLDAAQNVGRSWSGSSIGFHADVYYLGLRPPAPGHHFSQEWGFLGQFQGTTGPWPQYPHDDVIAEVERLADNPDLSEIRKESAEARELVADAQDDVLSMLRSVRDPDPHLTDLIEAVATLSVVTYDDAVQAFLPGRVMSRDTTALGQGMRAAPHQHVIANIIHIKGPFQAASDLAKLCDRAGRHLSRVLNGGDTDTTGWTGHVVIGHGRSPLWRELKDFVTDRLGLEVDEFNQVPTAGVTTAARLAEMATGAGLALLVATAEDEHADGTKTARLTKRGARDRPVPGSPRFHQGDRPARARL
ncbi:MAG: TIR domain-containing protein [Acidimicrobiales bacterium]